MKLSSLPLDIKSLLSSLQGRPLDLLYARLAHRVLNRASFFSRGWGDLKRVDWLRDRARGLDWPPPSIKIRWKLIEKGKRHGKSFRLLEGHFESPVSLTVHKALPSESLTGCVRLLVPVDAPQVQKSCVLHLPGTGDQGFKRRTGLSLSLIKYGIASLMLESPYYGSRKPKDQTASRLNHVSDLLTLGRATIEESAALLYWAKGKGFGPLGVCGLSMGGVHSCMVASLYPEDLACTPLLAPRSAAVAFCEGALQHGITSWAPLANPRDDNNEDILKLAVEADKVDGSLERLRQFKPVEKDYEWLLSLQDESNRKSILSQAEVVLPYHYYPHDNISEMTSVLSMIFALERIEALRRLHMVLEIYTDITGYPIPKRPDAAIFVAARDDAYASPHSAKELHEYWPGSELRWLSGGHVSSILFHRYYFCEAIRDSIRKLA